MRIAHVIADLHMPDSGLANALTLMATHLAKSTEVTIHALEPERVSSPTIDVRYYPRVPIAPSLGISPSMRRGLSEIGDESDIVHAHGLWTMPIVYAGRSARLLARPLVVSPHGMLEPWALRWHPHRKAIFSSLLQHSALRSAHLFHATSGQEAESIRAAGMTSPIAIVPLGVDLPRLRGKVTSRRLRVLYLSRLHPKKNVDSLMAAWRSTSRLSGNNELVVAGSGEAEYVDFLTELAEGMDNVIFVGAVYGQEKARLFESADLFVLPTHSENFGIVIAEALSYATPVIATTGTPWQGLAEHGCGWWVDSDVESLAEALDDALTRSPEALAQMGRAGREWIEREFSWNEVANKLALTYAWLNSDDSPPTWILK